ncbi:MAG: ExbD/TolR family protein, partial [Gemmataceae bacterium]
RSHHARGSPTMSSGGQGETAEPDLTPLLDLVLQMIMFFMLCGNFASEDVDASVKLPTAIQAKPIDKTEDYIIFLNVDKDGDVLHVNDKGQKDKESNARQVLSYLRLKRQLDESRIERAKAAGKKDPGRLSLVIIRADERCAFKKIHAILENCRLTGYSDVQLRATVGGGK